jgi:hypothetical protein
MKEQPEALSMADMLDSEALRWGTPELYKAAAELRRLHAENAELLEALRNFVDGCSMSVDAGAVGRAAIAKAEGEQA